jgi:hypothetical protein
MPAAAQWHTFEGVEYEDFAAEGWPLHEMESFCTKITGCLSHHIRCGAQEESGDGSKWCEGIAVGLQISS